MAAGIQVFNDSGNIQIDGDYLNLGLLAKVATTTNLASNLGIPYVTYAGTWIRYTTKNKKNLIALRCARPAAAVRTIDNGTTYTYEIIVYNSPVGTAITVYEFGEMPTGMTSSGTGFEVYTADGLLAFSSNYRYMKVAGWVDGSKPVSIPATYTYNIARQYAIVLSTGAGYVDSWFDGNADWENIMWMLMANYVTGGIYLNEYSVWSQVQSTSIGGKAGYTFSAMIIDVTGY